MAGATSRNITCKSRWRESNSRPRSTLAVGGGVDRLGVTLKEAADGQFGSQGYYRARVRPLDSPLRVAAHERARPRQGPQNHAAHGRGLHLKKLLKYRHN